MLKNSLSGKPLRIVERLGYTPRQYQTALEKLDQKYGGEKRLLQRHLKAILRASPVKEANLIRELEIFSDRLIDVVAKLEDNRSFCALHSSATKDTRVPPCFIPRVVTPKTEKGWTNHVFEMVAETSCLPHGRRRS